MRAQKLRVYRLVQKCASSMLAAACGGSPCIAGTQLLAPAYQARQPCHRIPCAGRVYSWHEEKGRAGVMLVQHVESHRGQPTWLGLGLGLGPGPGLGLGLGLG